MQYTVSTLSSRLKSIIKVDLKLGLGGPPVSMMWSLRYLASYVGSNLHLATLLHGLLVTVAIMMLANDVVGNCKKIVAKVELVVVSDTLPS